MRRKTSRIETLAVHSGDRKKLGDYVPVTTPIYAASSFFYERIEDLDSVFDDAKPGQTYSRFGNPTCEALEDLSATLEGADFAVATSSGMAALRLALLVAMVDRRRRILASRDLYGQTLSLLLNVLEPQGVEVFFGDPCDIESWESLIVEHQPSCVLFETISNPMLRVPSTDRLCELHRRNNVVTVVDSTFTTPVLMRPLDLGADIVIHSATKFLAGHGDALGGLLLAAEPFRQAVTLLNRTIGPNLGPFEAYITMRGMKTLVLRMEEQCANARRVAARLSQLEGVTRVHFPGDPAHPDHATAARLFPEGLFGSLISFDLEGGKERAFAFADTLKLALPATSLGDVHTMILHPATSSHRDLAPKRRHRLGIGDGLLRLSVGIEHVEDIVADLEQALVLSASAAEKAPS